MDIYNLNCIKDDVSANYGIAHISSIILSKKIRKIFIDKIKTNMICVFSNKFQKWEPKMETDKEISNFNQIKSYQ